MSKKPILIVMGGLPGVGKTTLSKALSKRLGFLLLRIDTIEQALARDLDLTVGAHGYTVAAALARENLSLGHTVIIDAVNAVEVARQMWRDIAVQGQVPLLQINVICSDQVEHRRRVETRQPDIDGHKLPTWEKVQGLDFAPWSDTDILIETYNYSVDELLEKIITRLG